MVYEWYALRERNYEPRAFDSHFPEHDKGSDSINSLSLIALRSGRDSHREHASREWVIGRNGTERNRTAAACRGALRFFSRSSSRARESREVRAESDGGRLNVMCLFLRRRYSHGQPPRALPYTCTHACTHACTHVRMSSSMYVRTYVRTYVARAFFYRSSRM